jgi:hypothetical protein
MIVCEYKNCRQREPPDQPDQGGLIRLIAFRQTVYRRLGPARDALFELGDAVLLSPPVRSFPELTLFPIFRRKWSSSYEAVGNGRPSRIPLLHLSLDNLKGNRRPLLAADSTTWPRTTAPPRGTGHSKISPSRRQTGHREARLFRAGLDPRRKGQWGSTVSV